MCSFPVNIFPLSFQFLVVYSYVYFSVSPPIFEKLVLTYVEQKESEFKRFPFEMEVYKHKLFTSGTLTCFSAQGYCFCKENFTLRQQVGSKKSKATI